MNDPISEEYRRVFYAAPFITDLGVELVAAGEGECTTSLELEERHWQQDEPSWGVWGLPEDELKLLPASMQLRSASRRAG